VSTAQTSDQSVSPLIFAVPYLLGVVVQLPLLISYMSDLASRPHYGLYLIGVLATIAIAAVQWPWGQSNIHRATVKSVLFAGLAVAVGLAGGVLGEPWFAALSVILLITSYLSATVHRGGRHSVGYAALPLFAFIRPPLNWDLQINAQLQEFSMELASRFLNFLGAALVHIRTDSAFEFIGKDTFLHVDSVIGIGSVFSLIFIALICVAIGRKNLFQTILLVLSCFLWAILLNVVYLMLLPLCNYLLEIEIVTSSVNHNMIRVFFLLATALMIFSTAEFFGFAFSPVDPEDGRSFSFGRFITTVWNSLLAGQAFVNETGQVVGRSASRITDQPPAMMIRWGMAGLLVVAGVLPLVSARSFESVSSDDVVSLVSGDMPATIDGWSSMEKMFRSQTFSGSGIQGLEKETWVYQSPELTAHGSIAEPFNMWTELPKFHKLRGWDTIQRSVVLPTNPSDTWQYVMTDMTHKTGEKQRIVFCYFDSAGQPVIPPASDSLGGRLSAANSSAQAPLFQVSLIHSHYRELTPDTDAALASLFLQFREAARNRVLSGSSGPSSNVAADTTMSESNPSTTPDQRPGIELPAFEQPSEGQSGTEFPAIDDQPVNGFSQ